MAVPEWCARLDTFPSWCELRDWEGADYPYCTLCWKYATDCHVRSAQHTRRLASAPSSSLEICPAAPADGDLVLRDGELFCLLCNKHATEDHMKSVQHERKWQWKHASPAEPEPGSDFVMRDGELFCLLCDKHATEGHVKSAQHQRYLQW